VVSFEGKPLGWRPAGNSYRTATFSNAKAVTSHNVKPAMFKAIRHFMLSMM